MTSELHIIFEHDITPFNFHYPNNLYTSQLIHTLVIITANIHNLYAQYYHYDNRKQAYLYSEFQGYPTRQYNKLYELTADIGSGAYRAADRSASRRLC